jgi:hypothetical protein
MVPERLVYLVVIRALAWASQGMWGNEHPGSVTGFQVLERWKVQP